MCRYNRGLDAQLAGKASEGLSKLLAYLRDEDERERLAGIERLKPVGTQVFFVESSSLLGQSFLSCEIWAWG